MAAGRKKARELKASGSLPGGGVATIKLGNISKYCIPVSSKYYIHLEKVESREGGLK